jgi:hypothetical protein
MTIATRGMQNPHEAAAASTDYLRMFGPRRRRQHVAAHGARGAGEARRAARATRGFYDSKVKTARFYFTKLLPRALAQRDDRRRRGAVMELDAAAFRDAAPGILHDRPRGAPGTRKSLTHV